MDMYITRSLSADHRTVRKSAGKIVVQVPDVPSRAVLQQRVDAGRPRIITGSTTVQTRAPIIMNSQEDSIPETEMLDGLASVAAASERLDHTQTSIEIDDSDISSDVSTITLDDSQASYYTSSQATSDGGGSQSQEFALPYFDQAPAVSSRYFPPAHHDQGQKSSQIRSITTERRKEPIVTSTRTPVGSASALASSSAAVVSFDDLIAAPAPFDSAHHHSQQQTVVSSNADDDIGTRVTYARSQLSKQLQTLEKSLPAHRIGRHSQYFQQAKKRQREYNDQQSISPQDYEELIYPPAKRPAVQEQHEIAVQMGEKMAIQGQYSFALINICAQMLYCMVKASADSEAQEWAVTQVRNDSSFMSSSAMQISSPLADGYAAQGSSPSSSYSSNLQRLIAEARNKQAQFVLDVVNKLLYRCGADHRCLITAVYYLKRAERVSAAATTDGFVINWSNFIRCFACVLMMSQKFHEDIYTQNQYWASVLHLSELEHEQRGLLSSISGTPQARIPKKIRKQFEQNDIDVLVSWEWKIMGILDWDMCCTNKQIERFIADFLATQPRSIYQISP